MHILLYSLFGSYLHTCSLIYTCETFDSDYKGWTCLHHAASEGYTQTMDILLSANIKLLDKTDEDGVKITTALKILRHQ